MTAPDPRAQALVERLYKAFNDSGFLGLGGTDEDAIFAALTDARDKNLMRDVDALYASNYPTDPKLRDELDDELSGDDLAKAVRIWEEGMARPAQPAAPATPAAGAKGPVNPVLGTLVPNGILSQLPYEQFLRKYTLRESYMDFAQQLKTPTPPPAGSSGASGSAGGAGSASLPKTPDLSELLTFEADAGKLHVKIQLPKEIDIKLPAHFKNKRVLELNLNVSSSDSGSSTFTLKLFGGADYTVTASIGVSDLSNPKLTPGLVFESTRSLRVDTDKEALKKAIQDGYDTLKKKYAEYQGPSKETDPAKKYYEKAKIVGDMAGAISDMYDAFDKARGGGEPDTAKKWSLSLGANIKLDKSKGDSPADKADSLDLTFKAVF